MKAVALRTGLTSHTVRVWERRYQAVQPERSGTRRRLYREEEVARLQMLAALTAAGHSIGNIARLPDGQLRGMLPGKKSVTAPAQAGPESVVEALMKTVQEWDIAEMERLLDIALVRWGQTGLLERVLVPMIGQVGEAWSAGLLTVAQEHAASAAVRDYLARLPGALSTPETAPRIIIATPAGQLHELGAAIAAAQARTAGWNVCYLGNSLPAEEIAGAAAARGALAVGLSIVYPGEDPALPGELLRLHRLLPKGVALLAGGRSAGAYAESLDQAGARRITGMENFTAILNDLREKAPR